MGWITEARVRYRTQEEKYRFWCPGPESNRHGRYRPRDFKSLASTNSATRASLASLIIAVSCRTCRFGSFVCRSEIFALDLTELREEFRAEFFNIFNHTTLGLVNLTAISSAAGTRSATAGLVTSTVTTARQVQFGMKLTF